MKPYNTLLKEARNPLHPWIQHQAGKRDGNREETLFWFPWGLRKFTSRPIFQRVLAYGRSRDILFTSQPRYNLSLVSLGGCDNRHLEERRRDPDRASLRNAPATVWGSDQPPPSSNLLVCSCLLWERLIITWSTYDFLSFGVLQNLKVSTSRDSVERKVKSKSRSGRFHSWNLWLLLQARFRLEISCELRNLWYKLDMEALSSNSASSYWVLRLSWLLLLLPAHSWNGYGPVLRSRD